MGGDYPVILNLRHYGLQASVVVAIQKQPPERTCYGFGGTTLTGRNHDQQLQDCVIDS